MKAANFAMIDSQYFCMFNKSEREMKYYEWSKLFDSWNDVEGISKSNLST